MAWDPFAIFKKPKINFSEKEKKDGIVYTIRPLIPQPSTIIRGFILKPTKTSNEK